MCWRDSDTAAVGDPIVQPGLIDAGLTPMTKCDKTQATTVATLTPVCEFGDRKIKPLRRRISMRRSRRLCRGRSIRQETYLYLGATADSNGVPVPGAPNAGSGVLASHQHAGRQERQDDGADVFDGAGGQHQHERGIQQELRRTPERRSR